MTLERDERHVRLRSCPLCRHEFRPREKRCLHFLQEHTVEDVPALSGGGARAD